MSAPRRCFVLLRTFFVAAVLMTLGQVAQAAGFVGAYIWGGTLTSGPAAGGAARFYASVDRALAAGFDTIRFKIGVGQASDYALDPDPCAGRPTLACYAKVMFASPVWDDPGLRRVILTTVDFACHDRDNGDRRDSDTGDTNGCLVASRLTANAAAIQAEYADLYAVLKARFGARPIQFIITNWEGDNFAYCGDSYRFAMNAGGFASTCKATWPSGQTNQQRVRALLQWAGEKQMAATRFRAANPGFDLIVATEFNTYASFAAQCPTSGVCDATTDTVFSAIAATGGLPYCSWSSYDSQGPPDGAYLAAAEAIVKVCKNLFVGEAGYDLDRFPRRKVVDLFKALDQIRSVPGVVGIVTWHAFDSAAAPGTYGLWTADGRPQVIDLMGPLRPTPRAPRPSIVPR